MGVGSVLCGRLPAGENRQKTGLLEDARGRVALVALDFDPALFHGAAAAAGRLDGLCQRALFVVADAEKAADDGDRFAAAMRSLPDKIDAPTMWTCGRCWRWRLRG